MHNNFYTVGAVFLVVLMVVYFGLFFHPATSEDESASTMDEFATSVGDENDWEVYENAAITFRYPAVIDVQEQDPDGQAVLLTYSGPTQDENTEFYDGLAMSFVINDYVETTSLQMAAEAEVLLAQEYGEIVEPLNATQVNGVDGWTYEFSGQGRFRSYFLPLTEEQYLMMVVFVADPTEQGFAGVKDKILNSLVIK